MTQPRPMPRRDEVDPQFDGHLEKPLAAMTPEEKIAWIWEAMQLLHAGRVARGRSAGTG
jgi:hypothetical protein